MISVLVPAYNEAASVGDTVAALQRMLVSRGAPFEIIVIDDGSTDTTAAEAEKAGAQVVRHPANVGYGNALKTGIRAARYDWIATIDADGTYAAEDLSRLLDFIPQFDLVVGARSGPHFWGSIVKQPMRRIFLWLSEFVTGRTIPDVNSGLRVFGKRIAQAHFDRISGGFSFSTTLTLAMLLEGRFVKYVPIGYRARVGKSRVRLVRDSLRAAQIIVQAIAYDNPIKLFVLLALFSSAATLLATAAFWLAGARLLAGVVLWAGLLFALLVLGIGCLTDAVRSRTPRLDR